MKITIKIDPETLQILQQMTLKSKQITGRSKEAKVAQSMRTVLFERLSQACINYTSNPNGKPRTLTLRYHLAMQLLEDIVGLMECKGLGHYEYNKLHIIKNELYQKLQPNTAISY